MTITYDPALVMLAIFVAITGAVTGLTLTVGFGQRYGHNSALSLLKGAIVIGLSVWTTHFVAMLAIKFPVPVGYNFAETIISLYAAIIGVGLGLFLARGQYLGPLSCVVSGIIMGVSVAGAHYIAMNALRGCGVEQSDEGIIATVTTSIVTSMVGLWFAFKRRGIMEMLIGGTMLGIGFSAVHLTAFAATVFTEGQMLHTLATPLITEETFSFLAALVTMVICGLFIFLFTKLTIGGLEDRDFEHARLRDARSFNEFNQM